MTDNQLDRLARRVMLDAARLEYGALPEEPHAFSPDFERRMKRLLRRGRHPAWHRTLRAAACLLLALLLSGCAVLAASPEAREAFAGWVREVYETSIIYRFSGEDRPPETDSFCRPAYVPEGYQMVRASVEDGRTSIEYRNGDNGLAVFVAYSGTGTSAAQVVREDGMTCKRVRVNGVPADLYLDRDPEEANVLLWTDGGRVFHISAPVGEEELLKMAESVEDVDRTAVYRPEWIPEGYFAVSAEENVLSYRNGEGGLLTVSYGYSFDRRDWAALGNGKKPVSVSVGESRAELYLNRAEDGGSHLVWVDGDSGVCFRVSGPLEGEDLIQIGESLKALPEPPLEERQLTWVPAGYREYDRVGVTGQTIVLYQNDKGNMISFGCIRDSEDLTPCVTPSGAEEVTPKTVLVNGKAADLYVEEGASNVLAWREDGLFFFLQGDCSAEELAAMAESQEVILPDRRPAWLPEGYVLYERSFLPEESVTTIYENPKGGFIIFRCLSNEEDKRLYLVPNGKSVEKRVSVNGHPADLYANPEPGRISELCWSDGEAFYCLSGDLPDGEILKVAESVTAMPPLPATHIPTWLPLGYRSTGVQGGLWSVEASYENGAGEQLQFRFARRGQTEETMEECLEAVREAAAGLEEQAISVDGCPGRLYPGGGESQLVWGPEGGEEVYWLSGPLDEETLLEVARGVRRTAENGTP